MSSVKKRLSCTNKTCLVRTCGRHRCHLTGKYNSYLQWVDLNSNNCDMYKGPERYSSYFESLLLEEYEDNEKN